MPDSDIAAALSATLPPDCVLSRPEERRPYECDALTAFRELPAVVVLPRTEEEVRRVLLTCARMHRVLGIDPQNRCARLQPGVPNLRISEAAAPYGLYYAPDPSSQVACSIGGNVAENSGGVHCLKYGLTVHNVQGVRGFTVDGELIELGGGAAADVPGLDLLALTIGSEGLLMIVTEVIVKLIPRPPCAQLVVASFPTLHSAADAVAAIIATGIIPAALEMM